MSTQNTGSPAFPSKKRIYRAGYATNEFEPVDGMTLRDYFAAKAMQGALANPNFDSEHDDDLILAKMTYMMADAMLKAREGK